MNDLIKEIEELKKFFPGIYFCWSAPEKILIDLEEVEDEYDKSYVIAYLVDFLFLEYSTEYVTPWEVNAIDPYERETYNIRFLR